MTAALPLPNELQAGCLVELDPVAIAEPVVDYRVERAESDKPTQSPEQDVTFADLCRSIELQGLSQPPGVRLRLDGRFERVYGARRIQAWRKVRPGRPIPCLYLGRVGEPQLSVLDGGTGLATVGDDYKALLSGLADSLHNKKLAPHEIAEALFKLRQMKPGTTPEILALQIGLDHQYVRNLIRIREKAHPLVWQQFRMWGTSLRIGYHKLLELVVLHPDEQLERWEDLVAVKRLSVGEGLRGRVTQSRPTRKKLERCLAEVPLTRGRHKLWLMGCAYAFKVALGKEDWRCDWTKDGLRKRKPRSRPKPVD